MQHACGKGTSGKTNLDRAASLLFLAGALVGGYGLLRTFLLYRDLPEGVCPFDPYRPLTYVALALLAGSIALDLLASFMRRKADTTARDAATKASCADTAAGGSNPGDSPPAQD